MGISSPNASIACSRSAGRRWPSDASPGKEKLEKRLEQGARRHPRMAADVITRWSGVLRVVVVEREAVLELLGFVQDERDVVEGVMALDLLHDCLIGELLRRDSFQKQGYDPLNALIAGGRRNDEIRGEVGPGDAWKARGGVRSGHSATEVVSRPVGRAANATSAVALYSGSTRTSRAYRPSSRRFATPRNELAASARSAGLCSVTARGCRVLRIARLRRVRNEVTSEPVGRIDEVIDACSLVRRSQFDEQFGVSVDGSIRGVPERSR